MAPFIFGFVSLVCMLQALAAPLRLRDLASEAADPNSDILPPLFGLNLTAINDAVSSIGAINTGNDAGFASIIQTAQQDITSVSNGSASDIAAGLNSALGDLNVPNTADFGSGTAAAIAAAKDQIAAANGAIQTAIEFTSLAEPEGIAAGR
ncbi:hypothetical protein DFH06DRAFT_1210051 [Mycena polygramma]|nr:hypothetical protein DFH06DRAFT_1210051 [Mycena polygramma]